MKTQRTRQRDNIKKTKQKLLQQSIEFIKYHFEQNPEGKTLLLEAIKNIEELTKEKK